MQIIVEHLYQRSTTVTVTLFTCITVEVHGVLGSSRADAYNCLNYDLY